MNGMRKTLHENHTTSFRLNPVCYPVSLDNNQHIRPNGLGLHSCVLCRGIRLAMRGGELCKLVLIK
jgi:hypothetical protein